MTYDRKALVERFLALKAKKGIPIIGGPVAEPEPARFILANTTNRRGFYRASSMERLPVETAITKQARLFKQTGRSSNPRSRRAGEVSP